MAEIQAAPCFFQLVHHAKALLIVVERACHLPQRPLSGMAEGRVAEIVTEGNGLRQILVQGERPGDGPRNAGHLQGVCKSCVGVGHTVHVPLKAGADLVLRLQDLSPPGTRGERAVRADNQPFLLLTLLTDRIHGNLSKNKGIAELPPQYPYTTFAAFIPSYFFNFFRFPPDR